MGRELDPRGAQFRTAMSEQRYRVWQVGFNAVMARAECGLLTLTSMSSDPLHNLLT